MKSLAIIRGVPGSGKSTRAKKFLGFKHVEADMYFTDDKGNYNFDHSKLREAHQWCKAEVGRHIYNGRNVVVSNTFTQAWEMEDYIKLATENGYAIVIIEMTRQYSNVHGVPTHVLDHMKERFHDKETILQIYKGFRLTYLYSK